MEPATEQKGDTTEHAGPVPATKKKVPKSVLKKRKARQNRKAARQQRAAVQERLAVKAEPGAAPEAAPPVKVEYVAEAATAPGEDSALADVVARFAQRAATQYERGLQRDAETDGSDAGEAGSDAGGRAGAAGMDAGAAGEGAGELSNRRVRRSSTLTVGVLKRLSARPDVVELHDVNSSDPLLHVYLKSLHNAVPVPRHWCAKRRYLAGKVGVLKPPFRLPQFIEDTGIRQVREAEQAREDEKSHAKSAARARMQPRMGRLDIDFRVLQAAFFRFQTKPRMTEFGDLYYEGKEHDVAAAAAHHATPGVLSAALQRALGMLPPLGNGNKATEEKEKEKEAEKEEKEEEEESAPVSTVPPPWLFAMQRLGPPPAYPHLRVPGVNAPLPPGAQYGFQPGGWGRPPVDEATGAALFGGDQLGVGAAAGGTVGAVSSDELAAMATHWGEFPEDFAGLEDDDDDMADDDDGATMVDDEDGSKKREDDEGGARTEADKVAADGVRSGFESSAGLATPAAIDLVKRTAASVEAEQQQQQQQQQQVPKQLYTVLEQQNVANPVATVSAHSLLGATHTYRLPGAAAGVDPAEDAAAAVLQKKYEQETADAQQAHELQQRYQDIAQPEEPKKPKKKKNKDKEKFKF